MIFMAHARYLPSVEVLVEGHLYSVSSGLGGSHTVKYMGMKNGKHLFFRKAHSDWPGQRYNFSEENVLKQIYINVPVEDWAEIMWDEERAQKPVISKLDEGQEAWFPPNTNTRSYKNLVKKGLING